MNLIAPELPAYSYEQWRAATPRERLRLACVAWATQGYGTPLGVYGLYVAKVGLYVAGWLAFCAATPGLGGVAEIGRWWAEPTALHKAILWSMLFEGLGLGCGSGPLTGRYVPPVAAFLHQLRPGTIKLPFVPGLPLFGSNRRGWLHVALYVAWVALLVRALLAPQIAAAEVLPVLGVLLLLALSDAPVFLMARAEHYATAAFVLAFAPLGPLKLVWLAVWLGAASSKLNRMFPSVVAVMQSNSPLTAPFPGLRRRLFRAYPDDLRPSRTAELLAHAGTATEFTFPLVLFFSDGSAVAAALVVMVLFHVFITASIPAGVPIEWNVAMVYGAFVLFGVHGDVPVGAVPPVLAVVLLGMLVALPVAGNLRPERISFLLSMRYYAGNWPYSAWLFRGDAYERLDEHLVKAAKVVPRQLEPIYGPEVTGLLLSKVPAFRSMHLQGRPLQELLPKAVDDLDDYTWVDGELVAGLALGWNFGDGHLSGPRLLEAIQERCGFAPGELRCVFVESQPALDPSWGWSIHDAADGELETGRIAVRSVLDRQPWEGAD